MAHSSLHECPTGCPGCDEFQRRLLLTDEGQKALRARFGSTSNATRTLGPIRACARVRGEEIVGINENPPGSVVGAIADGSFVGPNIVEVGIIRDPSIKIPGVAATALERLSQKAPADLLMATIDPSNAESLRFFLNRGFIAAPYEPGCGFVLTKPIR